jgi:hypothetical protein
VDISTSIEIDRPAGEVWAFVSDVRNNPRRQRGQQRCAWTSEPPLRAGSTYDQHARFAGRDIVNRFEVVEVEPGRRMRFRSTSGTFPLDPVMRPIVARTIRRDFPVLKRLLEEGQAVGAASRS